MNGIHDMGGMQDMGPIARERNEPVFHTEWERRLYGLCCAVDIDWTLMRRQIELIPPADYLQMSYYERWLTALVANLTELGVVTPEEVARGSGAVAIPKGWHVLQASEVNNDFAPQATAADSHPVAARFHVGQRVRARTTNPIGHTRLPRYVRGRTGTVARVDGTLAFEDRDANGASLGKPPQHVYCVRFSARELWGPQATPHDTLYVDLWEEYLDAA
jgi:nitrile hydratase